MMLDYLIALGYHRAADRQRPGVRMAIKNQAVIDEIIDWSIYHPPAIATPWNGRWWSGSGRLRHGHTEQPCRSRRCVTETVLSSERTIGSYWLPIWEQPTTLAEVRDCLGNHDGWKSDTGAAMAIARGKAPRGVSSYARWAIIANNMVIRGLEPR